MYDLWSRERLLQEREHLLRKLEKYEDLHMLDAWNNVYCELHQIDSILELCP